jgi:hypothetical protein
MSSIVFRQRPFLTLAELIVTWARELDPNDPTIVAALAHILKQDIANGRLDNAGPLENGETQGIYLITPANKAGYVKGRDIDLRILRTDWISDQIIVMREAALDFARRQGIPLSWWTGPDHSTDAITSPLTARDATEVSIAPPSAAKKKRGRKPTKLTATVDKMRDDIQSGRISAAELSDMSEKVLAGRYGVSRDTARKARHTMPQLPKKQ